MAGTFITNPDYQKGTNVLHGDTIPVVTLGGGDYAITAVAGTWNSGSLDFQAILADGSTGTKVSVLSAAISANKVVTVTLPAGQYTFVVTTTDNVYYTLSRIRRGAGA